MKLRTATQDDHKRLCQIARSHRAGQGFTNGLMFSGETHYAKGWLRVAEVDGQIAGFTCVRQKTRTPETKLYYIIVAPEFGRKGVGQELLNDLLRNSPHRKMALDCLKDNAPALAFYAKNGFTIVGESLKGLGHKLEKTW